MRHTHYFFEIREGGFPLFTELPREGFIGNMLDVDHPPNHLSISFHRGRGYASISSTSGTSSFSKALKRRAGIWLAGNLRVEVVAGCLYLSSCREGGCSQKLDS
jgi:hypothetical protein